MFENRNTSISQYCPCKCFELAGKSFTILTSSFGIFQIHFIDENQVEVSLRQTAETCDYYCTKAGDTMYFIHIELPKTDHREGLSIAADAGNGDWTFILAKQGHKTDNFRQVEHQIFCGVTLSADSHAYSSDLDLAPKPLFSEALVGRQIEYTYSEGFSVQHHYINTHKFEWTITREQFFPENIGISHQEYCDVVLLHDNYLLFSWLEAESGTQGCFILNTISMRTAGAFFGVGPNGLPESYPMGAFARVII